jgi:hypothetical protein
MRSSVPSSADRQGRSSGAASAVTVAIGPAADTERRSVVGIIDTLKDTVGLIDKVNNLDLYRKVTELQTQVIDLLEENRALKSQLATREQLKFDRNTYWLHGEGPFCSACYDKDARLVRLHLAKSRTTAPHCPVCNKYAIDPNEDVDPESGNYKPRSPWS